MIGGCQEASDTHPANLQAVGNFVRCHRPLLLISSSPPGDRTADGASSAGNIRSPQHGRSSRKPSDLAAHANPDVNVGTPIGVRQI
jgi:hypothetical protein